MTVFVDAAVSPRIITVPIVDGTSISCQSLLDQLRTWEERPDSQSYPRIVLAEGKTLISATGKLSNISLILQNAKLAFAARAGPSFVQCEVLDGNLTAIDLAKVSLEPIQTTAFTQVIRTLAEGGALIPITDQAVEGGLSVADVLRILLAAQAGDVSGAGTSEVTIVAADGSKTRMVATVDAQGNRTVTLLSGSL